MRQVGTLFMRNEQVFQNKTIWYRQGSYPEEPFLLGFDDCYTFVFVDKEMAVSKCLTD